MKLRDFIDWESFRSLLEELTGYATRDWSEGGQPRFDPVFMVKVPILQEDHSLSDDATEEHPSRATRGIPRMILSLAVAFYAVGSRAGSVASSSGFSW